MQARKLCLVGLIAGVLLVALSLLVPWLRGPRAVWTEEQAQQHARSAAKLHALSHRRAKAEAARQAGKSLPPGPHEHVHAEHEEAPTELQLQQARAEFESTKAALDRAKTSGRTAAAVLRGLGIACVLCGGGGYLLLGRMS